METDLLFDRNGVCQKTLVLTGATASGKSQLAVDLALCLAGEGIKAEIINADSMLVYRGMDIGTAKPSIAQQAGVRHHLIDIFAVTETTSVALMQQLARQAIAECQCRGVLPIVVGGSALYVRAIVDEFDFPPTDPKVRAELEQELARVGVAELYQRLVRLAPQAGSRILPNNARRIVRALEAIELTGTFTAQLPQPRYALPGVIQVLLGLPREIMDERIALRVEQMWQQGFVDEVARLEEQGLRQGLTASRALGYQQILAALAGEITMEQAKELTISGTKKFARKQLSWFRRDQRLRQISALDSGRLNKVFELLENN